MKHRLDIQDSEWNTHCLLCGDALDFISKHPNRNRTHNVEMPPTSSIRAVCKSRGDAWATEVELRLPGCIDLVAVEAEYHRQRRQNFYNNRSKPIKSKSDKKKEGRHKDKDLHNCFIQLCAWLQQQAEAYTMKELEEKLKH